MNKEQQQIIDEAYENFIDEVDTMWQKNGVGDLDDFIHDGLLISGTDDKGEWFARILTKEEFINKIKTDVGFSERWGLKIEERELDMMERWLMAGLTPNMTEFDYCNKLCDEHNVPTKLIKITYKNETIETYE